MSASPRSLGFLLLVSLSATALPAFAAKTAAVLPLYAPKLDADLKDSLEESIRAVAGDFLSPSGYTVIGSDETTKGLAAAGVDTTKPCETTCAVDAAKALKAWIFIAGTASKTEGEYVAFLRLVDSNSGRQLASLEVSGAAIKDVRAQFREKAGSFFPKAGAATPQPGGASVSVENLQTKIEPKSGLEFVRLPGGSFHYGCEPKDDDCFENERPGWNATVVPVWMGKTLVTTAAYAKCVAAGVCAAANDVNWIGISAADRKTNSVNCNLGTKGKDAHPINCVDWDQATKFCEWIGGRLPTAEEWEFAAKGGESRVYPWGNDPMTGERGNFCDLSCHQAHSDFDWADDDSHDGWGETSPVGTYPKGVSKFGLSDMAGNVYEWTTTAFNSTEREARGGSWRNRVRILRASARYKHEPTYRNLDFGVRCAM